MKRVIAILLVLGLLTGANAALQTEEIKYKQDGTELHGYLVYDAAIEGKRPGVLVVHEWWGHNQHARNKAEELARAGYIALAVDMYGEGKNTEHPEKAGEWSGMIASNLDLGEARFKAGYKLLTGHDLTAKDQIAAIGYCFGGAIVLNMAQRGLDLDGVVSFHGSLPQQPVSEGTQVKARVLVCHGAADPLISAEQVQTFQKNMTDAGADWQFIAYSGAKHGFTNPDSDKRGMPPLAYSPSADRRSWQAMLTFFDEIFAN